MGIRDMNQEALTLVLTAVVISMLVSLLLARRITYPIHSLAEITRAISRGEFHRRVQLRSRTEIGELAENFNLMAEDIEDYIEQLKRAAQENRELFMGTIRMVSAAIDEKDPYTQGHSGRVSKYSVLIAEELGLTDQEIDQVRISALLHDVGKIGIDDRVLKKPGTLAPEEYDLMKQHPTKGANILRPVPQLAAMIPGIELHHECFDGSGYPRRLVGTEIPLMARIIAVADTLDAITTNRPYQSAYDLDYAVKMIRHLSGKRFDPNVVEAFARVVEKGAIKLNLALVEA
jgi:putative nucleotidyltransferase with HDIG domain